MWARDDFLRSLILLERIMVKLYTQAALPVYSTAWIVAFHNEARVFCSLASRYLKVWFRGSTSVLQDGKGPGRTGCNGMTTEPGSPLRQP